MKMKIVPFLFMIFGIVAFMFTVYISIISEELPEIMISVGLILLGYLGIILFYFGMTMLKKNKTKDN